MAKLLVVALAAAALWGCTSPVPAPWNIPAAPTGPAPSAGQAASTSIDHYRCENGIEFTVSFVDDSAVVDAGPRGSDVLLRDAGGITPQQTVYSNARMRAEFGLGASGREAILRYPLAPNVAHCVQD